MSGFAHISAGFLAVQRNVLDPLKLELQAITSCPKWVMGTKLGSSARAASAFICWATISGDGIPRRKKNLITYPTRISYLIVERKPTSQWQDRQMKTVRKNKFTLTHPKGSWWVARKHRGRCSTLFVHRLWLQSWKQDSTKCRQIGVGQQHSYIIGKNG